MSPRYAFRRITGNNAASRRIEEAQGAWGLVGNGAQGGESVECGALTPFSSC